MRFGAQYVFKVQLCRSRFFGPIFCTVLGILGVSRGALVLTLIDMKSVFRFSAPAYSGITLEFGLPKISLISKGWMLLAGDILAVPGYDLDYLSTKYAIIPSWNIHLCRSYFYPMSPIVVAVLLSYYKIK